MDAETPGGGFQSSSTGVLMTETPMSLNLAAGSVGLPHAQSVAGELNNSQRGRTLTKPDAPGKNEGFDNENSDLIIHENDLFISHAGKRYKVKDMLGQGTFGQVCRCVCEETGETVAVKVIKNQPAYYHQARVEIGVLQLLNTRSVVDSLPARLEHTFLKSPPMPFSARIPINVFYVSASHPRTPLLRPTGTTPATSAISSASRTTSSTSGTFASSSSSSRSPSTISCGPTSSGGSR